MKRVLKVIGWSLFAIVVLGIFVFLFKKSKKPVVQYQIETAQQVEEIKNTTLLTGTIQPRNEVMIVPQLNGIVAEIMKNPGDMVQAGDIIARLTVVPEMMQLNSAESRVKTAKVLYDQAKQVYERSQELHAKGLISTEEFQQSEVNHLRSKEELSNAQEALQIVKTGKSSRNSKGSTTLVRATVSGKILDIPVKKGYSVIQANTFNAGTTIATVADMSDMIFIGKVDEIEVARIKQGMPVTIIIGALNQMRLPAKIEYISPKAINMNGVKSFEIKAAITLPNGQDEQIRAGLSANAEVVLESASDVVALPESTIKFTNDSTYVDIVMSEEPELQTEQRTIVTGVSNGSQVEIKSGVNAGDRVKGAEKIK